MSQEGGRSNPPPSTPLFDVKLLTEALEAKFKKMLDDALEPIHSEIYRNKSSPSTSQREVQNYGVRKFK